jgi:hypothetical protein
MVERAWRKSTILPFVDFEGSGYLFEVRPFQYSSFILCTLCDLCNIISYTSFYVGHVNELGTQTLSIIAAAVRFSATGRMP